MNSNSSHVSANGSVDRDRLESELEDDAPASSATLGLRPDGAVYAVSPTVRNLLDIEPEALMGTSFFRHVYRDDLLELFRRIVDVVNDRPPESSVSIRVRTGSGAWRTYIADAQALLENRHVVGILLTLSPLVSALSG